MRRSFFAFAAVMLAACGAPARSQEAESLVLDLTGPRPTAQLSIGGGAPVTAIVDTGAGASVLSTAYAATLGLPRQGSVQAAGPGGKPTQGWLTHIPEGVLGGAHFSGPLAVVLDIPLPLPGIAAVVPPDVFKGRIVRFDFPNGLAEVVPATAAAVPAGPGHPYTGARTILAAVGAVLPGGETVDLRVDTGSDAFLSLPYEFAARLPLSTPLTPTKPARLVGIVHPAFMARVAGTVKVGDVVLQDPEIRFLQGGAEPSVGFAFLRNTVLVLDPAKRLTWVLPPAP